MSKYRFVLMFRDVLFWAGSHINTPPPPPPTASLCREQSSSGRQCKELRQPAWQLGLISQTAWSGIYWKVANISMILAFSFQAVMKSFLVWMYYKALWSILAGLSEAIFLKLHCQPWKSISSYIKDINSVWMCTFRLASLELIRKQTISYVILSGLRIFFNY